MATERREKCYWLVPEVLRPCSISLFYFSLVNRLASRALVHLTKNIMHTLPNEKKKIQVVPEAIVCHVDESPLWGETVSERPRRNMTDPAAEPFFSRPAPSNDPDALSRL